MANNNSISYKTLAVIIVSLSLGFSAALFFSVSLSGETSSFSAVELIGFVLSIILSGASIVLAISAISLGRASEDALIRRSDDSIKLQNEVYTKTTEALQSIKASTGVTEKRIEDIIAGRAGDISKSIAEYATQEGIGSTIDADSLEKMIKDSLADLQPNSSSERQKRTKIIREEVTEKKAEYNKHHDELLYEIVNTNNLHIEKLGHGSPSSSISSPEKIYDAIFVKDDKRIALTTFAPISDKILSFDSIPGIIFKLSKPIIDNRIDKLILVAFTDEDSDPEKTKQGLEDVQKAMNTEVSSRINTHVVDYKEIKTWASKKLI